MESWLQTELTSGPVGLEGWRDESVEKEGGMDKELEAEKGGITGKVLHSR